MLYERYKQECKVWVLEEWITIICICVLFSSLTYGFFSSDWTGYKWTGIGDEGATALADLRVIKHFKTLE